jgi:DNA-directed RNA polymerase subunit F
MVVRDVDGDSLVPTSAVNADWRPEFRSVINGWRAESDGGVISADVDGLLSCALLAKEGPVNVVGIYTTTHLLSLDKATREHVRNALWLDHDVSRPGIRCVGQHLVHHHSSNTLPLRESASFNPNVWQRQAWEDSFSGRSGKKRDKFPFGTCHFIAAAMGVDLGNECSEFAALLAHADGTWRTVVDYRNNADTWYQMMFQGDNFLLHLRDHWEFSNAHLDMHKQVVDKLVAAGVGNHKSRARIAELLPDNKKELTGRQSIQYKPKNPKKYIDDVVAVLSYIQGVVGSNVQIGSDITDVISGRVETPYPDRITDFDEFMQENKIFSHAFTDLRMLRYTTDIEL